MAASSSRLLCCCSTSTRVRNRSPTRAMRADSAAWRRSAERQVAMAGA
jgi:hypothetical protein